MYAVRILVSLSQKSSNFASLANPWAGPLCQLGPDAVTLRFMHPGQTLRLRPSTIARLAFASVVVARAGFPSVSAKAKKQPLI
ncbi:hypothetical protein LMG24238_01917 [Paraburkholderia sediminicola]|uniref:Uncharacterized protein n=1 Tax=Paraburkholderia sediminicola TaxID=458836 RepID=A0A6J5AG09_9BURK|nr:hypothetical protein LMG24238_01917 [Paraburkholderia sediminicola]